MIRRGVTMKSNESPESGSVKSIPLPSCIGTTRYLIPFALCIILGCGSGSPFDYVKVSGKISYDDGSPLPAGVRLRFASLDPPVVEGAVPRPAIAHVDAQGNFECVTSYKYGDGLIPGKHKVVIEGGGDAIDSHPVPKEYTALATTPLEVDTDNAPFDIKVPKPPARRRR
jgi:hypothetical protein